MFAGSAATAGHEAEVRAWSTGFRDALRRFAMPGEYANFVTDEGPEISRACYGDNVDRLARLKARYDPENVFRRNHNIVPAR
jgi:FAD/FMN-containing dehydrogenase